jgi:two-component system, response regulator
MKLNVKIPAAHRSGSILMVDDEELDIEAATRGLRKSNIKNTLLSFPDGPPFIEYLNSIKNDSDRYPALVLLDINMPLMSGFEVLRHIRAEPCFAEIPVVTMLTSSTHDRDREEARSVGANDYLIKPSNYNDYTAFFNALFE